MEGQWYKHHYFHHYFLGEKQYLEATENLTGRPTDNEHASEIHKHHQNFAKDSIVRIFGSFTELASQLLSNLSFYQNFIYTHL